MFASSQITWYGKSLVPLQMTVAANSLQVIQNVAMAALLLAGYFISSQFVLIPYAAVYYYISLLSCL